MIPPLSRHASLAAAILLLSLFGPVPLLADEPTVVVQPEAENSLSALLKNILGDTDIVFAQAALLILQSPLHDGLELLLHGASQRNDLAEGDQQIVLRDLLAPGVAGDDRGLHGLLDLGAVPGPGRGSGNRYVCPENIVTGSRCHGFYSPCWR